jgi:hypothetical protein
MYLAERKQYRETGVLKKAIKRPYYINPEKELERINKIKKEYQRLEEKDQS